MILLMNVDKDNPSVAEGESVQIQGAGLTGFEPKGNTEQATLTGKNLFKPFGFTKTSYGITFTYSEDGSININGTSTGNALSMNSGEAIPYLITLTAGTYTISGGIGNVRVEVVNSTGQAIGNTSTQRTFEITSATQVFIRLNIGTGFTFNNAKAYPQLEVGSQATDYEPYCGGIPSPNPDYPQNVKVVTGNNTIVVSDGTNTDNYSLNLGSIELCKIGDYQDYIYKENNKWYKHSEIGKVVLDGSEDWMLRSDVSQTSGYYTFRNNDYVEGEFNTNSNGYSNYFGVRTSTSTTTNHIRLLNATGYGTQICIDGSIAQTSQALKTWLSTNNVEVYYIKITPTNTEIIDTELKEDLETISNIALFEGVNNISMESSNLTSSFKVYYDTWYEFDKILRNGYNIREDRDRITQKFANGHRKQFVSDYVDCSITLNLDTIDKDTTQDYLQRLKSGAYKYYSIDGKEYRTAQFIIENKPELSVESSISNNVDVNEYQITLLKAGD